MCPQKKFTGLRFSDLESQANDQHAQSTSSEMWHSESVATGWLSVRGSIRHKSNVPLGSELVITRAWSIGDVTLTIMFVCTVCLLKSDESTGSNIDSAYFWDFPCNQCFTMMFWGCVATPVEQKWYYKSALVKECEHMANNMNLGLTSIQCVSLMPKSNFQI